MLRLMRFVVVVDALASPEKRQAETSAQSAPRNLADWLLWFGLVLGVETTRESLYYVLVCGCMHGYRVMSSCCFCLFGCVGAFLLLSFSFLFRRVFVMIGRRSRLRNNTCINTNRGEVKKKLGRRFDALIRQP